MFVCLAVLKVFYVYASICVTWDVWLSCFLLRWKWTWLPECYESERKSPLTCSRMLWELCNIVLAWLWPCPGATVCICCLSSILMYVHVRERDGEFSMLYPSNRFFIFLGMLTWHKGGARKTDVIGWTVIPAVGLLTRQAPPPFHLLPPLAHLPQHASTSPPLVHIHKCMFLCVRLNNSAESSATRRVVVIPEHLISTLYRSHSTTFLVYFNKEWWSPAW